MQEETKQNSFIPKVAFALIAVLVVGVIAFLESKGVFELNAMKPSAAHLVATPAFTSSLETALTGKGSVVCEIKSEATGGAATVSVKDGMMRIDRGLGSNAVHALIRGEYAFLWEEEKTEGRVENALSALSFGFASKYEIARALAAEETQCSAFALSEELFALPVGVVFPGAENAAFLGEGEMRAQNIPETIDTPAVPFVVEGEESAL